MPAADDVPVTLVLVPVPSWQGGHRLVIVATGWRPQDRIDGSRVGAVAGSSRATGAG
jgi:hypothetical protein